MEAWLLPAVHANGPAPLVVFAHGNGELIDDWPAAFEAARAEGFAILLVEYPGYGRSAGAPSEASIGATLLAAFDLVTARSDIDPKRIVGYGRSLGGGAMCLLAAARPLAALVLESTFTSVRALAWRFAAPGFLVRDPFDNLTTVRRFAGPLLVLHGQRDEVIPFSEGRALAEAHPRAEFRPLPCGHNDCPDHWAVVSEFLRRHGAGRAH